MTLVREIPETWLCQAWRRNQALSESRPQSKWSRSSFSESGRGAVIRTLECQSSYWLSGGAPAPSARQGANAPAPAALASPYKVSEAGDGYSILIRRKNKEPLQRRGSVAQLFGPFCPLTFAQADTRAAAVLVDEFDASSLQRPPNCKIVHRCQRSRSLGEFCSSNCRESDGQFHREVDGTPLEQRARRSDLCARETHGCPVDISFHVDYFIPYGPY